MLASFISRLGRIGSNPTNDTAKAGRNAAALATIGVSKTLSRQLSIRIGLAILCTALLALTVMAHFYGDFSVSRQNLYDIQNYRQVLDAANRISAERGPANTVMSEDPSQSSPAAKRLAIFRARSDAVLDQLAAVSDDPLGLHHHPIPPELLAQVRDQLALARKKVDNVASLPHEARRIAEVQDAIESMFAVSDRFGPSWHGTPTT